MQKSRIEWTEFVSNPITGKCKHGCYYCYAERIRNRFNRPDELKFHPEELESVKKRKKPATIFMGSMHDIWGAWIPDDWLHWIVSCVLDCPQHTFLLLTKNPKRYFDFWFPENCYLGYTDTGEFLGGHSLRKLNNLYVSFEPLLGANTDILDNTRQIIIGAMTGKEAVIPKEQWVYSILERGASRNISIFIKDNLCKIYPDLPKLRKLVWRCDK